MSFSNPKLDDSWLKYGHLKKSAKFSTFVQRTNSNPPKFGEAMAVLKTL